MISTKKTVVYLRNSAGFQENSIALQKERALLCANQNGLFIDGFYEDKDTSAVKNSIKERHWLYRLIKDIEEERVGTIIVYKRDRLARKVEEHMILYALFEEKKVKVYFSAANEFPMVYSPQGFTIEYLLASFAENEEVQLKQRISDTRAAKFKTGKTIPANLPFRYKREVGGSDGKKKFRIVLVPHEIKVVKTIFSTLLHGNFQTLDDFRIYLKVNRISTRGN
ncbi:recombinase family protein [Paenibacillus endoradicis]|uniref:recombinase family protein n=1 Tax=Paenibacillus endoradicis TaxID=2972487 RepID=UPI0021596EDE|nr:recombinase family protein [Paenibacillus endoradicis]MCR8655838.1 recombinase family protein [Paenibacillus endoradicis]MCR8658164.1 recombinase family protein [Paenibacillus endoradicis]